MTFVATGPGRIAVVSVRRNALKVILGNFDIDGDQPKRAHIEFIETRLIEPLLRTRARVEVMGGASHSGGEAHNLALSGRRAHNVVALLAARGVRATQIAAGATGEWRATPGVNEHALDRNVIIKLSLPTPPPPPPPPPPLPTPPPRSMQSSEPIDYRIRMLLAFGLELEALGQDHVGFQVWDAGSHRVATYQYAGANFGIGTPTLSWIGNWNQIPTTRPLSFAELEGWARFGGMGAFWWDRSYLYLRGHPAGAIDLRMDPFDTGFTLGISISFGTGHFDLVGGPFSEAQWNAQVRFPPYRVP